MALLCPVCGLTACYHNLPLVEVNDLAAELEVQHDLDAEVELPTRYVADRRPV
jgi:hypothetical protein